MIDPERGIVSGVALLRYPKLPEQPQMYVSEIFKIVAGRIVKIDYIGLMMEGVTTLGHVGVTWSPKRWTFRGGWGVYCGRAC